MVLKRKMEFFFVYALCLFGLGVMAGTPDPEEDEVCLEGKEVDLKKTRIDEDKISQEIRDAIKTDTHGGYQVIEGV